MKRDITTAALDQIFKIKEDHTGINKYVKAVIINFNDSRGDIIVYNDNYKTRRKYADFTEGKRRAGLHPMQIVFAGLEIARITHDRYIGPDDKIHTF